MERSKSQYDADRSPKIQCNTNKKQRTNLSKYRKMNFMSGQSQHDQIRILFFGTKLKQGLRKTKLAKKFLLSNSQGITGDSIPNHKDNGEYLDHIQEGSFEGECMT